MPMRITRLAGELQVPPSALLAWLAAQGHSRYAREDQQLPDDIARLARARVRDITVQSRLTTDPTRSAGAGGAAAPPATPPRPAPSIAEAPADMDLLATVFADVRPLSGRAEAARPKQAVAPPRGGPAPRSAAPAPKPPPPTAAPAPAAVPTSAAERAAPSTGYVRTLEARVTELETALAHAHAARLRDTEAASRAASDAAADIVGLGSRLADAEAARDSLRATLDAVTADAAAQRPVTLRALLEARGLVGDDEIHLAFRALGEGRMAAEIAGAARLSTPGELAELLSLRLSLRARGEPPPTHGACAVVEVPAERADAAGIAPSVARLSTACLIHGVRAIAWIGGAPHHHRALRERLDPRIRAHTFGPDRLPHASLAVDARFLWDPARALSVPGAVTLSARTFALALDQAARALSDGAPPGPS
jgi:hypothetical protein